ncbi:MAG: bacterial proteasome activator family protein [Actinomycetota bacterium]
MSDAAPEQDRDDVLVPAVVPESDEADEPTESVESPGKVMRIGSMIKQLLEEVRQAELDEASRERLREIYETSVDELAAALSPDLEGELKRLAHPFDTGAPPSEAELRVAKAQLVGWLEGLFHGIQATLFAQQMAARQQLEQMQAAQQRGLRPGPMPPGMQRPGNDDDDSHPPGTYL